MSDNERNSVDYATLDDALLDLCSGLCSSEIACRACEPVEPPDMPEQFAKLLVHNDHMTSRLKEYHGQPVALSVLDEIYADPLYRRKIILTLEDTGEVVEFGVVRVDFRFTPPDVRAAILEHRTPLGDLLIQSAALRRIEPRWYVKLSSHCPIFAEHCGPVGGDVYGRIGTIYCNGDPAVELLEVVTTLRPDLPAATNAS